MELTLILVVIAVSLAGSHRLTANGRSAISIGLFAFIGAASLLKSGPAGYSPFYLTMAAVLAGLFHGRRGWLAACLINTCLVGVIGVAASNGWIQTNYMLPPFLRTPMAYVQVVLIVLLVSLLLLQVVSALVTQLNEKSHDLGERVKELTALHATSRLLQEARGFDQATARSSGCAAAAGLAIPRHLPRARGVRGARGSVARSGMRLPGNRPRPLSRATARPGPSRWPMSSHVPRLTKGRFSPKNAT